MGDVSCTPLETALSGAFMILLSIQPKLKRATIPWFKYAPFPECTSISEFVTDTGALNIVKKS